MNLWIVFLFCASLGFEAISHSPFPLCCGIFPVSFSTIYPKLNWVSEWMQCFCFVYFVFASLGFEATFHFTFPLCCGNFLFEFFQPFIQPKKLIAVLIKISWHQLTMANHEFSEAETASLFFDSSAIKWVREEN